MKAFRIFIVALVLALIAANLLTFKVDETQQALLLEFGKPLMVISDPGLYFKLPPPFRSIEVFERRLLIYDSPPNIVVTEDKKNLVVDAFARWRITDPLLFRQTVRTEGGAQARLDDIIYSDLLRELGQHDLDEIVTDNREFIMESVTHEASLKSIDYGIEILDVRIKRTDLPQENEVAIFRRMQAERHRIASLYRSEGEEAAQKLRAIADKDVKVILADAYKEAQIITGKAEAEAIDVYAKAFNRDPAFFEFTRALEMYRNALDEKTTIVLPPTSELFKYLQ